MSLIGPLRALAAFRRGERGQSIVEIAFALPLFLVLLVGVVDLGRGYAYSSAVSNAAREAAIYAAKNVDASEAQVIQRACDELGFSDYGAGCAEGVTVTCAACPSQGQDVTVSVTYTFSPISGSMFSSLLGTDQLTVRGSAFFPGLGQ